MDDKKECTTFEEFVATLNAQEQEILVKLWCEQSFPNPKKNGDVKIVIDEKLDR